VSIETLAAVVAFSVVVLIAVLALHAARDKPDE
jgi:hypothetical protein